MASMGQHSAVMNGHRGEDGSATAPVISPFIMPRAIGPVSAWPPAAGHDDAPDVHPAPPAPLDIPAPRRRMDGDRLRCGSMWVLASGVAAIAAIVSYSHIYDLGRAHGGTGVPARLLPLSVDMLILVGELMLLHEADGKGRRFILGWVLIWSGILATLAANVAYGYQFGIVGAIIWGWPAYSFILAASGIVAVAKRGAARDTDLSGGVDIEADAGVDIPAAAEVLPPQMDMDIRVDIPLDIQPAPEVAKTRTSPKVARTSRSAPTAAERVAAILKDNPRMSNVEVANLAGVSAKTVQRVRPRREAAR